MTKVKEFYRFKKIYEGNFVYFNIIDAWIPGSCIQCSILY